MRALIVDDIQKARVALKADLEDYCPEVELVGEAGSVAEAVEKIGTLTPEVIFLDIQLGDGTGFDVLKKVNSESFKVIFTTAYDEFAVKAFRFNAIDYLLKPIDPDELVSAVKKVNVNPSLTENSHLDSLLKQLKQEVKPKRIALSDSSRIRFVEVNEIMRCEAEKNYTTFYLNGGEKVVVTETLKTYDELLAEYGFIRSHHSHLVNPEFVKELVKTDGSYLRMLDGAMVPVSVRKKEEVLSGLRSF